MSDESAQPDDASKESGENARFRTEPEEISPNYVSEVTEHINRHAVAEHDACPVCGHWFNTVMPSPLKVEIKEAEGAFGSGRIVPLLATVCHNCGYVRLFHRLFVERLIEAHKNGTEKPFPTDPPVGIE